MIYLESGYIRHALCKVLNNFVKFKPDLEYIFLNYPFDSVEYNELRRFTKY